MNKNCTKWFLSMKKRFYFEVWDKKNLVISSTIKLNSLQNKIANILILLAYQKWELMNLRL